MITSPKNPRIAAAAGLKKRAQRDEQRRFLVEGTQNLTEALATGTPLDVLFTTDLTQAVVEGAKAAGVAVEEVAPEVMERLSATVTPPGSVGVASFIDVDPASMVAPGPLCLSLLAACRDPGNAGAVVRSTAAVGGSGVIFGDTSVDVYNPKTVRASAGSLFHLPHTRAADIAATVDQLRAAGVEIVAASADGAVDIFEAPLSDRVAFLLGNEAWGLPAEVAALADRSVAIPLLGPVESLNLAAAATVCLYEWRRRLRPGALPDIPQMIDAAAHDLRSPSAGVKSFVSTLLARELEDAQRRMLLEGIAYDADRMGLVIQQLVDVARLASGDITPFDEVGDVAAVIEELQVSLARNPDHPEIRWTTGAPLEVSYDRGRVRVAVAACIELMVWFASDGPVDITGSARDGILQIDVVRGGATIAADEVASIFEARKAGSGGGSKLGPFVARETARAFGGDLVGSVAGGSLRLVLSVPISDAGAGDARR